MSEKLEPIQNILQDARTRAAGVVLAGMIMSGCVSGGNSSPEVSEATTPTTEFVLEQGGIQGEVGADTKYNHSTAILSTEARKFKSDQFGFSETVDPKTGETIRREADARFAKMLTVGFHDGKMLFSDVVPGGMTEANRGVLLTAVQESSPFLRAAAGSGSLDRIVFGTYEAGQSEYVTTQAEYIRDFNGTGSTSKPERNIYFYFDPDNSVDPASLSTKLRHETMHALTGKNSLSIGGEEPTPEDLRDFADVCRGIRNDAIKEALQSNSMIAWKFGKLAEQTESPAAKEIFAEVAKAMKAGRMSDYMPTHDKENHGVKADIDLPDCTTDNPWYVTLRLAKERGLDFKTIFGSKSEQVSDTIGELLDMWDGAIEKTKIYAALKESNYLSYSPENATFGHPYDGWDELAASSLNILAEYPDRLAQNLQNESSEQRKFTLAFLDASIDTFVKQNPKATDLHELFRTNRSKLD